MSCTLAQKQVNLCTSGIGKLTDPIQLLQVTAQAWCGATLIPPDPYDNALVYVQVGGAVTTIPNPTGAYNFTALLPKVTEVHCHNAPNISSLTITGDASLVVVDLQTCVLLKTLNFSTCANLPSLDLATFTSLTTLNLASCSSLATLTLTLLQTITTLTANNSGLTTVSLPALTACAGAIDTNSSMSITSWSAPLLVSVTGNMNISNGPIASVNLNSLQTVGGFLLMNSSSYVTISLPALLTVGSLIYFQSNTLLTSISCPLLTSCDQLHIENNALLVTANFPSLQTVNEIYSRDNPALATFTLTSLQDVSGNWSGSAMTSLATLLLPSVTGVGASSGGDVDFQGCTNLVTFSAPTISFGDGFLINFDSCALNQASVDSILARGVASATTVSQYELNTAATNSAPSAAGIINKNLLIAAGNTVNTN